MAYDNHQGFDPMGSLYVVVWEVFLVSNSSAKSLDSKTLIRGIDTINVSHLSVGFN